MERLAWYGPVDRYNPAPGGGMCISVFAVVKKRDSYLIGRPRRTERWFSEWVPAWNAYAKKELDDVFRQWRLPSGYLREGEPPDECARRVVGDQLGVKKFKLSTPRVYSYAFPSDWYPGHKHWDIVFAYDVVLGEGLVDLNWWRDLRFVKSTDLQGLDFGWNEDLMVDLGIVREPVR